ncbi:Peptidyl-prolyl cis-trans isomerase, chloroplastic [Pleodorina starrii]|uniref:peptidylprolyl isomerase n=1 Tax=Pleodorina starrii TaxID=330485 RepID=A0A9W6BFB0_9CHLO|nr:Peptidyl-prolyl cis-trans isomerase [Pleodorina starrii]GLC51024.1 Peptidyl-prolyl cis-trans isomerase, chloroplastic [Pleodorina starrii]
MAALMNLSSQSRVARAGSACPVPRTQRAAPFVCRAGNQKITGHDEASTRSPLERAAIGLATAAAVVMGTFSPLVLEPPAAHAILVASDPVKNASAILRNALPINNKPIRQIQKELEGISEALRIPGSKSLGPVSRAVRASQDILTRQKDAIVKDFAPEKKEYGLDNIEKLAAALTDFQATVEAKDKQAVPIKQREALTYVGNIEEAMVKGFPFQVPPEYADRPLLLGRTTLEMKVNCRETPEGPQTFVQTIVLDGYNAPVSAGQFLDLVQRGFYDGMEVQRADGFVVQTGDPEGPADGFVDPKTGEIRRVPFEVRVQGDKEPIYDFTLEDLGRVNEQPVLPFNAYGTLAWARNEFENNSASSQVFFLLKESELTPTGSNLLDGRFAVFGYITQGQDALADFKVGDKIEYIKVVDGAQNLKNGPSA